MTDRKFLAQLNLYLDGEIDPAGAAELEQEILSNPARRRTYNDYCRIHRATQLVCEQFRAAGAANGAETLPPARTATSDEASTVNLPTMGGRTGGRAASRPFRVAVFATGLAAACAVGVFIGTSALAPRAPEAAASAPTTAIAEPVAPTPLVAAAPAETKPVTFTAPFAPEVRSSDPFVQLSSGMRNDPFALRPWTSDEDFARLLPSQSNVPTLKVDPRFKPASLETSGPESAGQRENGPFRPRVNEQSSTAPAEFGVQP